MEMLGQLCFGSYLCINIDNSKGFTSYKHTHSHTHIYKYIYIYIWNMINIIKSLSLYAHSGTSNEMGLAALYASNR